MYAGERKLHLIEEVIKVENEMTLIELEAVLNKSKKIPNENKQNIYDFLGILSNKEATIMKKAIEQTSEIIHPDDWK